MTTLAHAPKRVRRPVIILGAPRSGTTLLCDLLDVHPDVRVVREPRLVWRYGNDGRSDQLRAVHARPEVVDHIHGAFAAMLAPDVDADIDARSAGRTAESRPAEKRMVEKTPANTVRPWFVDAVFPDAYYVHITRDGWAAVPSMRDFSARRGAGFDGRQVRKMWRRLREAQPRQIAHYLPELAGRVSGRLARRRPMYGPRLAGHGQLLAELGPLEVAALQWRTCVDSAATFGHTIGPQRYRQVQLERLDVDGLASLLDFCGLPVADEVLDGFRAQYRPEAGLRRGSLSDKESALIAPYVVAANMALGYHEPSLVESGSAAR